MLNIYGLKSYYWEKVTYSKLWISKFEKLISRSVFEEPQLTQMSLNIQTVSCNLKIRGLGAKLMASLFLFWKVLWRFEVKESMLFVEHQKRKIPHIVRRDKLCVPARIRFFLTSIWLPHGQLCSFTNLIPITAIDLFWPKGHRVPRNKVGSQSPAKNLVEFESETSQFRM